MRRRRIHCAAPAGAVPPPAAASPDRQLRRGRRWCRQGAAARGADAIAWRDALEAFEAGWLAPALAALRSGRLDGLCLLAPGELGSAELQVSRSDLRKFWRKPRALNELASQ